MTRKSIGAAVMAVAVATSTGIASATPPYGVAWADTLSRGPAVGDGVVTIAPGSRAYVGSYALDPGSTSGWRTQPGLSMLAVTAGTVRVVRAAGCAVQEYTAPDVAVLPAGTFKVSNAGSALARFTGYFDKLGANVGTPLVSGRPAAAPQGCGAGAAYRASSTGLTATDLGTGVFADNGAAAPTHHAAKADRLAVHDGGDVVIIRIRALPGTSRGWSRHGPALAILTHGQLDTYVPTKDGCAKVEEVRAGQAATHAQYVEHLSVVRGSEPVDAILVYWGMGNNRLPMPGLVDFVEANDFTPGLPAGCTVL